MKLTLATGKGFAGLGACIYKERPTIYFKSPDSDKINAAQSDDGYEFERTDLTLSIADPDKTGLNLPSLNSFNISPLFKDFIMFYKSEGTESDISIAKSNDQINWTTHKKMPDGIGLGRTVENFVYQDSHVFYFGGKNLKLGLTQDGSTWNFTNINSEGFNEIEVDYALKTSQGIFLLYHHYSLINDKKLLEVKAVCFDKNNPSKVIWHTKSSLWQEPGLWENSPAKCIGCINFQGKILSYWDIPGVGIYLVTYPFFGETPPHEHKHYNLDKHPTNPVLTPDPKHSWENEAVFNAAAFYDKGTVYLIYRAVGYGYISVLGYAESKDGVYFGKRLAEPIFTGNQDFDTKKPEATFETARNFISGGGYGGCEDPRVTLIDDRLYMIYVAFNGWDPPRLAMTSILYKDFLEHRFLWEKPVLISPPGMVDKSGCILPEKINGKYVIFHRIYPDILIDFVDDLNFDGTRWLKGEFKISPRATMWDSRKVGTGAPPIKTGEGWLMIYQGVTDNDDSKYKIGAMLLDIADPTKVLYRTDHPIIEPTEYYENGLAKFGVVYPCGAVIKDGKLFVYYGGSDSVTCVATANLEEFLNELKSGSRVHLSPVKLND
jgi:predicted GH43/DUF377 family glycosyl hydrolase